MRQVRLERGVWGLSSAPRFGGGGVGAAPHGGVGAPVPPAEILSHLVGKCVGYTEMEKVIISTIEGCL